MKKGIGVGVITCESPKFLSGCMFTLPDSEYLTLVNDGTEESLAPALIDIPSAAHIMTTPKPRSGVAIAKNMAIKDLLDKGCDHIFIVEDDMVFLRHYTWEKYIELSKITGIQHFNFGFHGKGNMDMEYKPAPKYVLEYPGATLCINSVVTGACSYYSRVSLEEIGYMDTKFYNAWEHIEHTYRMSLAGFTTPFWNFADLGRSYQYIEEQETSGFVVKNEEHVMSGLHWFKYKHNLAHGPNKNSGLPIEYASTDEVYKSLRAIHSKYSEVEMQEDQWLTIKHTLDEKDG